MTRDEWLVASGQLVLGSVPRCLYVTAAQTQTAFRGRPCTGGLPAVHPVHNVHTVHNRAAGRSAETRRSGEWRFQGRGWGNYSIAAA